MSTVALGRLMARTGKIAEPAPPAPDPAPGIPAALRGSVQVRHVDAGSCNGCEIEIGAAFGPVYDAERYGARLVASPRHADALLVTGAVTHNMAQPLRLTHAATPDPKVVIACGDCALGVGPVCAGHGVAGTVADVVGVDVTVPGCPPRPEAIVAALRSVTGR
ncbi:MAG: oxidoreductase [Micrococcales bacterium]|nr:oxidoreductase [Micrococcales bacterium]